MTPEQLVAQRLMATRYVRKIGLKQGVHWIVDDDGFVCILATIATERAMNKYFATNPEFAQRSMAEFRKHGFNVPRIIEP